MRNSSGRFEDILDRCIVAIQTRGQTIEDCLARYPNQRAELEPLLLLAVRLNQARALTAPDEFRQAAAVRMHNLITAASHQPQHAHKQPVSGGWAAALTGRLRPSRAMGLLSALVIVLLVLSSGTVFASASALPGQPLYPIKTTVENLQLALTGSEANAARLRISLAEERLREAAALIERDDVEYANAALYAYVYQIEQVLTLFDSDTRLAPPARSALARLLAGTLSEHQVQLAALRTEEAILRPPALEAALTISQSGQKRSMLLLGDEPLDPPNAQGAGPEQPPAEWPGLTPTATATPSASPTDTPTSFRSSQPGGPAPSGTPTPDQLWPRPTTAPTRLLPTDLPTRRPVPDRTTLPTTRPVLPTDLPSIRPTERPARPGLLPTRPIRPTGLPPVRPPARPTATPTYLPTAQATDWPTSTAQTETPWPTPPTPPAEPTGTPTAPPDSPPPRPILPPGLRETLTAVPRPNRTATP